MLSPGYIRVARHPEHGEAVVYAPGQLLPQWVTDALDGGALLRPVSEGVFELVRPSPARAGRRHGSVKR